MSRTRTIVIVVGGSLVLDLSFAVLDQLAFRAHRCETRNGSGLASAGFSFVLGVEEEAGRIIPLWARSAGE